MTTEAGVGVTWPQAKECWQPPEAGRGQEQILLEGESLEGARPG